MENKTSPVSGSVIFIAITVFIGIGIVSYLLLSKQGEVVSPGLETPALENATTIPTPGVEEVLEAKSAGAVRTSAQQVNYVDEGTTFALAEDGPTVIFFKASWCPTCQAAQRDIDANFSKLPDDLVIVTADYDAEGDLKDRYGITYQHTWVQVDPSGEVLSKWNGGGVSELNQNIVR